MEKSHIPQMGNISTACSPDLFGLVDFGFYFSGAEGLLVCFQDYTFAFIIASGLQSRPLKTLLGFVDISNILNMP